MKIVPVFVISSSEYLNFLLVMIWSVMQYASSAVRYEFYVCHDNIDAQKQLWMHEELKNWGNCKISFLNMNEFKKKNYQEDVDFTEKMPCFSLFAPAMLPQYDKLLVLDADVIVKRDIFELYNTDLGDNLLGAVYDLDFIGQWMKGNRKYMDYYQKLRLPDPMHYIQAGVLLLNSQTLRKKFPVDFLFDIVKKEKFQYDDQDIWNLYCSGRIQQLDYRWNVIHDNDHFRIRYIIEFAPKGMVASYLQSRKAPFIIHYAGNQKPWHDPECDFAEEFWEIARKTSVYRELEAQLNCAFPQNNPSFDFGRLLYHEFQRFTAKMHIFLQNLIRIKQQKIPKG